MERLADLIKKVNPRISEEETAIVTGKMLDSIELVELVSEIEETYQIEIPINEISPENFDSLEAMKNLINRLQ